MSDATPGTKLFVGGLAWTTGDNALYAAFERFGPLREAVVPHDRQTGRSRGFGFVTFVNDADALAAVDTMNGNELHGRKIRVHLADGPRPQRPERPQRPVRPQRPERPLRREPPIQAERGGSYGGWDMAPPDDFGGGPRGKGTGRRGHRQSYEPGKAADSGGAEQND